MDPVRIIFTLTLLAELLLGAGLVLTLVRPGLRIWPPPGRDSWQYRGIWALTLVSSLGVVLTGLLDWNRCAFGHWLRLPVGGALAVGGLLLALWGVRTLSVHASLGLGGRLVESGPYRYTRNPQYVGDIALLLGWAILCNSLLTWMLCLLGMAWFALAPFTEEPWLREQHGPPYDAYRSRVPRFVWR